MTRRSARLEVTQLGDRILPSATLPTAPAHANNAVVSPQATLTTLSGSGQGTYLPAPTVHGAGPAYALRAAGTISGMGAVTVTGTLRAPALNASGSVTGTFLIRTAAGSVTISVTAPEQSGHSPLPTTFQYQVIASSGHFAGSAAQGTMHLTLVQPKLGVRTLTFSF